MAIKEVNLIEAKRGDEVTPEMMEAIHGWFDGKFMKGGGNGLKPFVTQIRKFTPLSTPPKVRKIYRAALFDINKDIPDKVRRSFYERKAGKIIELNKTANTLKSWTTSEKAAVDFYTANYKTDKRGRGRWCAILEIPFDVSEYVTDADSVVKILKPVNPQLARYIQVSYVKSKEVIMFLKPQPAVIKRVLFHQKG